MSLSGFPRIALHSYPVKGDHGGTYVLRPRLCALTHHNIGIPTSFALCVQKNVVSSHRSCRVNTGPTLTRYLKKLR